MRIRARERSARFGRQVHEASILKFVLKWLVFCCGFLYAAGVVIHVCTSPLHVLRGCL